MIEIPFLLLGFKEASIAMGEKIVWVIFPPTSKFVPVRTCAPSDIARSGVLSEPFQNI